MICHQYFGVPYSFALVCCCCNIFFSYYNTPVLQLKSAFPRKDVPSAPPKHAFLRINSSRLLLEEVKCILKLNVLLLVSPLFPVSIGCFTSSSILFRVLLLGFVSNCYGCREGMHWRSGCRSYFLTLTCQEVLLLLLFLSLKLLRVHVCAT